jgi:hypothetical protein
LQKAICRKTVLIEKNVLSTPTAEPVKEIDDVILLVHIVA